jgi:uncharacterized spore protein YtfJ
MAYLLGEYKMDNDNPIKITVDELKKLLDIKNFVGEPIENDDKLMIPFLKWGFGFGTGKGNSNDGGGLGSAGAAGIEPISIVVLDKKTEGLEGIKVLNLSEKSEKNKVINDLGLAVTDLIKEVASNSEHYQKCKTNSKTSDEKNNKDSNVANGIE